MKLISKLFLISLLFYNVALLAQEEEEKPFKHNRLSLTLGNALIPSASHFSSGNNNILIPTWGFSYEYLFSEKFGLGLKNDIEISTICYRG